MTYSVAENRAKDICHKERSCSNAHTYDHYDTIATYWLPPSSYAVQRSVRKRNCALTTFNFPISLFFFYISSRKTNFFVFLPFSLSTSRIAWVERCYGWTALAQEQIGNRYWKQAYNNNEQKKIKFVDFHHGEGDDGCAWHSNRSDVWQRNNNISYLLFIAECNNICFEYNTQLKAHCSLQWCPLFACLWTQPVHHHTQHYVHPSSEASKLCFLENSEQWKILEYLDDLKNIPCYYHVYIMLFQLFAHVQPGRRAGVEHFEYGTRAWLCSTRRVTGGCSHPSRIFACDSRVYSIFLFDFVHGFGLLRRMPRVYTST